MKRWKARSRAAVSLKRGEGRHGRQPGVECRVSAHHRPWVDAEIHTLTFLVRAGSHLALHSWKDQEAPVSPPALLPFPELERAWPHSPVAAQDGGSPGL